MLHWRDLFASQGALGTGNSKPGMHNLAMRRRRDDFSEAVRRRLARRAGNRCSFPGCGASTEGPSSDGPEAVNSVGVAAHITAASPGGPRFDPTMSSVERRSIENAIWMCSTHG